MIFESSFLRLIYIEWTILFHVTMRDAININFRLRLMDVFRLHAMSETV